MYFGWGPYLWKNCTHSILFLFFVIVYPSVYAIPKEELTLELYWLFCNMFFLGGDLVDFIHLCNEPRVAHSLEPHPQDWMNLEACYMLHSSLGLDKWLWALIFAKNLPVWDQLLNPLLLGLRDRNCKAAHGCKMALPVKCLFQHSSKQNRHRMFVISISPVHCMGILDHHNQDLHPSWGV
jgi:hypothetical protein